AVAEADDRADREVDAAGEDDHGLADRRDQERHRIIEDRGDGEYGQLAVPGGVPHVVQSHHGQHEVAEKQRRVPQGVPPEPISRGGTRRRHRAHAGTSPPTRSEARTSASAVISRPRSSVATRPSRMTRTRWQRWAISAVSLE